MASRRVGMAPAYAQQNRKPRTPRINFNLKHKPFVIQPFMCHPVLPGETMKNILLQARVVTDPLSSPLVGWWLGYWWFYVKHRDLDGRDDFTEMMLDMDKDMSAYESAADVNYYHAGGGINWAKLCLKRIVEEYWRNEGEAWDAYMIDGMPIGSVNHETFMNSLVGASDFDLFDQEVDGPDANTTIQASEVDAALRNWQMLRANNMTDMSYEDYLATFGVRTARQELHRPELIRFMQDWGYPTNTIDPATGSPSTAQSWSIAERADKDRYFSEPGFVVGITCCRPKIYFENQAGSLVGQMKDALAWLPAMMHHDPATSLRKFATGAGVLTTLTDANGYWLDMRDLLIYGEQFLNYDPATVTDANIVSLPAVSGQRYYVSSADVDGLFADPLSTKVHQDGVVNLNVLSRQDDHTPGTPIVA